MTLLFSFLSFGLMDIALQLNLKILAFKMKIHPGSLELEARPGGRKQRKLNDAFIGFFCLCPPGLKAG